MLIWIFTKKRSKFSTPRISHWLIAWNVKVVYLQLLRSIILNLLLECHAQNVLITRNRHIFFDAVIRITQTK